MCKVLILMDQYGTWIDGNELKEAIKQLIRENLTIYCSIM